MGLELAAEGVSRVLPESVQVGGWQLGGQLQELLGQNQASHTSVQAENTIRRGTRKIVTGALLEKSVRTCFVR